MGKRCSHMVITDVVVSETDGDREREEEVVFFIGMEKREEKTIKSDSGGVGSSVSGDE